MLDRPRIHIVDEGGDDLNSWQSLFAEAREVVHRIEPNFSGQKGDIFIKDVCQPSEFATYTAVDGTVQVRVVDDSPEPIPVDIEEARTKADEGPIILSPIRTGTMLLSSTSLDNQPGLLEAPILAVDYLKLDRHLEVVQVRCIYRAPDSSITLEELRGRAFDQQNIADEVPLDSLTYLRYCEVVLKTLLATLHPVKSYPPRKPHFPRIVQRVGMTRAGLDQIISGAQDRLRASQLKIVTEPSD